MARNVPRFPRALSPRQLPERKSSVIDARRAIAHRIVLGKPVPSAAEGPAWSASEPLNSSPVPQPIDEQVELDQTLMYQVLVQQVLTSPSYAPEAAPNPEASPCPDTTLDWV